jgi:hypothetical protein
MEDDSFVLLTVAEMRQKFYQPNELPPRLSLRSENVPKSLQKLIPIAERWGISDDLLRQDARRTATPAELKYLMAVIDHFDDALDDWLAGPEAALPIQSAEYLAFSNMRIAADGC